MADDPSNAVIVST